MKIDFKKVTFPNSLRVLILFGCLIFIADSLPLLFLGTTSEEKSPIMVFAFSMVAMYIVIKRILLTRPRQFYKAAGINESVQELINGTVGPAPWYWQTFPAIQGNLKNKYIWNYHGESGKHSYLVSLSKTGDPKNIKIVLNSYTHPFLIHPTSLGLWYVQNKQIHMLCFDPEKMPSFTLEGVPADFRNSQLSHYTLANPVAEVVIPITLNEGLHTIWFPEEFSSLEEILMAVPYSGENAAYAVFEVNPSMGEVKVMPQEWFVRTKFDPAYQWISRIVRDPESGKLYGDGIRIGIFELSDDGCHLARWVGVS